MNLKRKPEKMTNKEKSKKRIEQIALNLVEKNQSYNDILFEFFQKNSEDNSNFEKAKEKDDNEETKKDKIFFPKFSSEKEIEKIKNKLKRKLNENQEKNPNKNRPNENLKLCTSINKSLTDYYYCCKKNNIRVNSSLEDENEKNNEMSLISINNKENKNMNVNNDNLYLIKFNDCIINDDVNLDEYNKILNIYKYLLNNINFNFNINDNKNNTFDIIEILSNDFIQFIFEGKINIFLQYFNYSIDIIKFIFYQIFIFLNLLYLYEIKELSETFEISSKSLLLYSSQNYELILNVLSNPSLCINQEIKLTKSFYGRNKIIYSILKAFSPEKKNLQNSENIKPYENIIKSAYDLINEIELETKLNRTKDIRNNIYNKFDKFITSLKANELLSNKIKTINKKRENSNINIDNILNNINTEEDSGSNNNTSKKIFSLPLSQRDGENYDFKYTLFIELDETIVHYYEEGDNYYVKVRQGTEEFLKTLKPFCEIIIVSTSSKEYTDIILDNLNKDKKYIDNAIYKDLCDSNNTLIDFSKINRDSEKCIFICHNKNGFFNPPERNVIELKEFNGDEDDKEIVILKEELIKLNCDIDDIRNRISDIKDIIKQKRN